jgi:Fe-S-cluster containining protein
VILRFHVTDMDGPSAPFAQQHWHEIPDYPDLVGDQVCAVRCDAFDPDTRECTAYEDRPPICSGYPWYGKTPDRERLLDPCCSFNADVRTLLSLTVLSRG